MIYPMLVYDWQNYKPRELGMIARALTLIIQDYYRQAQKLRPGWEPFDDMICGVYASKKTIIDQITLEKQGGKAIKDKCWTVIQSGFGFEFPAHTSRIAHEIGHSVIWRYYNSGKLGVNLIHYYFNANIPLKKIYDTMFKTTILTCDLEYLVSNKERIVAEIKAGTAPISGTLPYNN